MSVEQRTLPNGARIVVNNIPHVETAAAGFYFDVGARFETKRNNGVAHFLEHMAFKGTKTRDVHELAVNAEDMGAYINAFTSHQNTCYYMGGLGKDAPAFVDWLGDIICNSTLPKAEIERERGAIIQEINRSQDNPAGILWSNVSATCFAGQPLGRTVLGPVSNIETMSRRTLKSFMETHYHTGNLVISVAGNVDNDAVFDRLEKIAGQLPSGVKSEFKKASYKAGVSHDERQTAQVNLAMCFNSFAKDNPMSPAASVLGMVLGSGMSSRLFREIREQRGLVYTVAAGNSASSDHGLFRIYAGTGPEQVKELIPVLCDELNKIRDQGVSAEEVLRAKTKVAAGMAGNAESMQDLMLLSAGEVGVYGRVRSNDERMADLQKVTPDDVKKAANIIFSGKPTFCTVGPGKNVESYDKITSRLKM